jgi:hypothetical protein
MYKLQAAGRLTQEHTFKLAISAGKMRTGVTYSTRIRCRGAVSIADEDHGGEAVAADIPGGQWTPAGAIRLSQAEYFAGWYRYTPDSPLSTGRSSRPRVSGPSHMIAIARAFATTMSTLIAEFKAIPRSWSRPMSKGVIDPIPAPA